MNFTRRGIEVEPGDTTIFPEDMRDWFEQFNEVESWFESWFDHDDCVSAYDLDLALANQWEAIEQNLQGPDALYHDDNLHTGPIKWCEHPVCRLAEAARGVEEILAVG